MAELSVTAATLLSQYYAAYAAQRVFYAGHVRPADAAMVAIDKQWARSPLGDGQNPEYYAACAVYDAARAQYDRLVDVTNDIAKRIVENRSTTVADLATKLDVFAREEMSSHCEAGYLFRALRADAHALAEG
jgi:hypothetical protein